MSETCPVTIWPPHSTEPRKRHYARPCGLPANDRGLCDKHEADRVRLGGGK